MMSDILLNIGLGNGLSPDMHWAIVWNNTDILLFASLWTNIVKFESKYTHCLSRKRIWKCHLQNEGHFVQASDC